MVEVPMLRTQAPIGVMDSGVGGISVLRHIRQLLPAEDLLYVADTAYMPYGEKSPEVIRQRVEKVAQVLLEMGSKVLVVACNTATAFAVDALRRQIAVPVIGMEPGVKPATLTSRSGVVGVLATTGTLRSPRFVDLVGRFAQGVDVILQPCPGLVEQVERHELNGTETRQLLRRYILPILERGADTLVLGCTHYPFLLDEIRDVAGPKVVVIDTGPPVARQLQRQLIAHRLLNARPETGSVRFLTTGDQDAQAELFTKLWGETVQVERIPLR